MQPDRPVQTTLAFHASRIVIDVGVLLAMASMSMSFVVADVGNRSALNADALPVILMLLPIFAVTLIPDHTRPIHPIAAWASLAFGLAALPYALVKMLDAGILADTLNGSVGLGARLMVIGCLVTLVGIGIGLYRNLRGLPAGGTPGRSATFRTRSRNLAAPDAIPRPVADTPEQPEAARKPGPAPTRLAPRPAESETPAATPAMPQPDIVTPDATPTELDGGLFDTAERADAALDDHLLSMFDDPDDEPSDG